MKSNAEDAVLDFLTSGEKPPPYRKQGCLDGYGLLPNNRCFQES